MALYAEIALNQGGARQTYHYSVPDTIRPIVVGQLVEVNFGTARAAGIVINLTENSPVPRTKPILSRLDLDPVVTPEQIELARWMSEHTLTSLGACLWLMLPGGVTRSGDRLYTLISVPASPSEVPEQQAEQIPLIAAVEANDPSISNTASPLAERTAEAESKTLAEQVIALLQERGPLRGAQIDHALPKTNWKRAIAPLLESGAIKREAILNPPTVGARYARTVSLAIPPERFDQVVAELKLKPGSGRAKVLNFLRDEPEPINAQSLIEQTKTNSGVLKRLADKGLITFGLADTWRDPLAGKEFVAVDPPPLTPDQAACWQAIRGSIEKRDGQVFLLHGVTGSGKTELYLQAIDLALAQGRRAIALVPEIALVPQTVRRFMARFRERVALVHSDLTPGEQFDTWRRARAGDIDVVIGARSALFTPLPDIGVIILDEEHDASYKQSPPIPPPYYHARDVAIEMARIYGATLILGSATPDLVTSWRAERGTIRYLHLPDRVIVHRARLEQQAASLHIPLDRYLPTDAPDAMSVPLPPVNVVDMRQELRAGNRSMFSRALRVALNETLAHNEQAMLYLNRRGTATFVLCRDCGYIAKCPRCDTPLTYHESETQLICHGCNYRTLPPTVCPECGSGRIRYFGAGTAMLEGAVATEFPQARVLRWDRDTTRERGAHEAILERFVAGEANVLIGTQMIAKGLDIPRVTLVGVVSADTSLGLPDYRTGERAFQLLTQVAGRAGRGWLGGRVILQTYQPDHYAVRAAAGHDYAAFYAKEIEYRRELGYPPFKRLARVLFRYDSLAKAQREAERAAETLREAIRRESLTASQIIGPAPSFFSKVNDVHRWQLLVKSTDPVALLRHLDVIPGMYVDIDPVDIL